MPILLREAMRIPEYRYPRATPTMHPGSGDNVPFAQQTMPVPAPDPLGAGFRYERCQDRHRFRCHP